MNHGPLAGVFERLGQGQHKLGRGARQAAQSGQTVPSRSRTSRIRSPRRSPGPAVKPPSWRIGTIAACLSPFSSFSHGRDLGRVGEHNRLLEHPHQDRPLAPVAAFIQSRMPVFADLFEQLVARLLDRPFRGRQQRRAATAATRPCEPPTRTTSEVTANRTPSAYLRLLRSEGGGAVAQ